MTYDPTIHRQYSPTITHISTVTHIAHNQHYNSTRSWSLYNTHIPSIRIISLLTYHANEVFLSLSEPFDYGLLGVPGKTVFLDHVVMQVITQEFSTGVTPVTIVDSEEGTLGPRFVLAVLWFHNVQNYGDTVLVVGTHETLVRICWIGTHYSISFHTAFRSFMIRYDNTMSWLQRQLLVFIIFLTLINHLINILSSEHLSLTARDWIHLLRHVQTIWVGVKKGFQTLFCIRLRLCCIMMSYIPANTTITILLWKRGRWCSTW